MTINPDTFKLPRKMQFLLDLITYDDKAEASFSDFERYLGYNKPQPDLRELLDFLEKQKILIYIRTNLGIKMYRLEYKRLLEMIDGSDFFESFTQYVKNTRDVYII